MPSARVAVSTSHARRMRLVAQELIELEATEAVGAARYERTDEPHHPPQRLPAPGCSRPRPATSTLHIPKLREGSFFPSLLEPRRRIDRALWAVVMEAYVHGVSTRKVDDLVAALGIDAGVGKSEVSRICAELDEVVRRLPGAGPRPCPVPLPVSSTPPTSRRTREPRSSPRRSWSRRG